MFGDSILLWAHQEHTWTLEHFGIQILSTVTFGAIGIGLAVFGFKLFDYFTPGKLDEEILQKHNMAAAILGAAIILGICHIVAAVVN
jgi:uncharacterized membrane protein YjfL (UPF0719 family)